MRTISSIEGNTQMLDGGAMFGNAPKALWTRWTEVDELNRIPLACRAMLIEEENRTILFETGIGAFSNRSFESVSEFKRLSMSYSITFLH